MITRLWSLNQSISALSVNAARLTFLALLCSFLLHVILTYAQVEWTHGASLIMGHLASVLVGSMAINRTPSFIRLVGGFAGMIPMVTIMMLISDTPAATQVTAALGLTYLLTLTTETIKLGVNTLGRWIKNRLIPPQAQQRNAPLP